MNQANLPRRRRIHAVALFSVLATAACGPTMEQMHDKLRTRAAFDLDCAEDQITVTDLDQSTSGASGCGRRASYLGLCSAFACTWIRQGSADHN
jgi:hypothetical protein